MEPHVCPVCGGRGFVPNGFYSTTNPYGNYQSTSTGAEICRACQGTGVLWGKEDDSAREGEVTITW